MQINVIRFKVVAKKRNHRKENLPIGSAIKYKRHALRMTLEEASKDICSVSYLSKLENNIIVPSERYVMQLKQRFCLNEATLNEDPQTYQTLKRILIHKILNNQKLSQSFINQIGSQTNYQTSILMFGVHVLNQHKDKAYHTYQKMIPMIASMPDESFAIAICLLSRLLYDETRYQEANEILAMLPHTDIDRKLFLYRDKWVLINAIRMNNMALFHLLYPTYQHTLIELGYYKQVNELRCHMMTYFSNVMDVSTYQALLKQNRRLPKKFQKRSEVMNLLANGYYEKALNNITKQNIKQQSEWLILLLLALDGLNRKDDIKQTLRQLNQCKLSYHQALIVNFIKAKHQYDKRSLLTYLRTVILGDNFLTDDAHILAFIRKHAHALFKKHFYYKEAAEIYDKFTRKIDMLKRTTHTFIEEPNGSFFL